jgi:FkbM family methyltransferase
MINEVNKIVQTRYGKMLYNKHDTTIGKSLEKYGEWCQLELEFLTPYIPYGGICVDVGAYIGTHTLFFAEAVGREGIVVAFEAQQPMFQLLCGNVALNHHLNVRAFNLALDETPGLVHINNIDYREPNHFGGAAISRYEGYPIEARTLDDCSLPAVDLLKIDVEGFEPEVINSAVVAIRMYQPFIYIEYQPMEQSQDLVPLIQALDYDVYEHDVTLFNPRNFKKCYEDMFQGLTMTNLFCVPKSKEMVIDLPLKPE